MSATLFLSAIAGAFALGWRLSPRRSYADLIAMLKLVNETLTISLNRAEHPLSDRLSKTIASAQALSAQAHSQAVGKPASMPRGKHGAAQK
jgi:hypothetical protein